jgi:two-component system, response regulator
MAEKIVLLVEDNPDDEELTRIALQESSIAHQLMVVRNGAEALDYLFATGAHAGREATMMPQLILLDLKLSTMTGLEVLRRLRADERTKLIPVVILTSSIEDEDLLNSYRIGTNGYVRKQVDFSQFSEAVRLLGLYWLTLNEAPQRRLSV